jgi:hypothetical protein
LSPKSTSVSAKPPPKPMSASRNRIGDTKLLTRKRSSTLPGFMRASGV